MHRPRAKRISDFDITRVFYPDDTLILNRGGTHFQTLVSDIIARRERSLQVLASEIAAQKEGFISKHWFKLFVIALIVERVLDYLEVIQWH